MAVQCNALLSKRLVKSCFQKCMLKGKKEACCLSQTFPSWVVHEWVEFLPSHISTYILGLPASWCTHNKDSRVCLTWIGRIWKGMLRHIARIYKAVGIWKQNIGTSSFFINHYEYGRWSLGYFPEEGGTGLWRQRSSYSTVHI